MWRILDHRFEGVFRFCVSEFAKPQEIWLKKNSFLIFQIFVFSVKFCNRRFLVLLPFKSDENGAPHAWSQILRVFSQIWMGNSTKMPVSKNAENWCKSEVFFDIFAGFGLIPETVWRTWKKRSTDTNGVLHRTARQLEAFWDVFRQFSALFLRLSPLITLQIWTRPERYNDQKTGFQGRKL